MKTFTFYHNRYKTATTSKALHENGIQHIVMCHTEEDAHKFEEAETIASTHIAITNKPRGLTYQRNAALDLMNDNEWAAFMCDDFQRIVSRPISEIISEKDTLPVEIKNQSDYRLRKTQDAITLKEMYSTFPYLIKKADSLGVRLIGFGLHDNPLNLRRKFARYGLADGRFWLIKKTTLRFDENVQMIDDVAWTAENIRHFGSVLVCNWIVPYFQRYTADGFGSIQQRLDQRRTECKYLVEKFAPLIRYADKPGWPEGTHIRLQYSKTIRRVQQGEFKF